MCFEPLRDGLVHRVVRHGEGDLGDDHVPAIVAGQIDALGETRQAKQVARLARIDGRAVVVKQALLRGGVLQSAMLEDRLRQRRGDRVELPP